MMLSDNQPTACGVISRASPPPRPSDYAHIRDYRSALVERHLREELRLSLGGTYTNNWAIGLEEIVSHIVTARAQREHRRAIKQVGRTVNQRLTHDGLPPLTLRQINRFFSGVSREQREALRLTLVDCGLELEVLTVTERWYLQGCKRDVFVARDATIENEEWELISGVHPGPLTLLRIYPKQGDVAELDRKLCTVWPPAAVEQRLVDPATGRYGYRPDVEGCYRVRVYCAQHLEAVKKRIDEAGFVLVREESIPVTEETMPLKEREQELNWSYYREVALGPMKDSAASPSPAWAEPDDDLLILPGSRIGVSI